MEEALSFAGTRGPHMTQASYMRSSTSLIGRAVELNGTHCHGGPSHVCCILCVGLYDVTSVERLYGQ